MLSGTCKISHKRSHQRTHGSLLKGSCGMAGNVGDILPNDSTVFGNRWLLSTFMVTYLYIFLMTQVMASIVIFTKIVAKTYFEKRES